MSTRIMTPHCRPRLARALAAALCVLAAFSGTAAAQDVQQLVGQVSQASYRHFLDDLLYTRLNDSRALGGPQHDPARTNIVNALAGFGLEVRLEPFTYSYGTHYNVVGVLRGTVYPERQYLVGAHYDTVNCPGANDNGSGVAALLEAARVLSKGTYEATIVFIAFDREEQHLVGSAAYAREHAGDQIAAMLNLDTIAYNVGAGSNTARLLTFTGITNAAARAVETALSWYSAPVRPYFAGKPRTTSTSDHEPFDSLTTAVWILNGAGDVNNHTRWDSVDTPNQIDYAYATAITRGAVGYLAGQAGLLRQSTAPAYTISTVAGGAPLAEASFEAMPAGGVAITAEAVRLAGGSGDVFFLDEYRVRKIDGAGGISTVAGTGQRGPGFDGWATQTLLLDLTAIAADRAGSVYFAERLPAGDTRVRKLDGSGMLQTVGTVRGLRNPGGLAVDPAGNVYISDLDRRLVLEMAPGEPVTVGAELNSPGPLAVDPDGNLYIADLVPDCGGVVRRVDPAGNVATFAGGESQCFGEISGLAQDSSGRLLVVEPGLIRRVEAGAATVVARAPAGIRFHSAADGANGLLVGVTCGILRVAAGGGLSYFAGRDPLVQAADGDAALFASLGLPARVAAANGGGFVAASADRVFRVSRYGTVAAIGEGFGGVRGLADDGAGGVFVAGSGAVYHVAPDGSSSRALAEEAGVSPSGLAMDGGGGLYTADPVRHRVLKIRPGGETIAIAGEDGALNTPSDVALDAAGTLYIADTGNHCIRKLDATGGMGVAAGACGTAGFAGDGGPASAALLRSPLGVAAGPGGILYIADSGNQRVRMVDAAGVIETVAGHGGVVPAAGQDYDGVAATGVALRVPASLAAGEDGVVYLADPLSGTIRKLVRTAAAVPDCQGGVVHGASLRPGPAAPAGRITLLGTGFGPGVDAAPERQPAFSLAGKSVTVRYGSGAEQPARLLYGSPDRIDMVMPEADAVGPAVLTIRGMDGSRTQVKVAVEAVVPGLFSADGSGQGAALAEIVRVQADGARIRRNLYSCTDGACVTVPVEFAAGEEALTLVVYATGVRNRAGLEEVRASLGGTALAVLYAGAHDDSPGLDRIEVRLPAELYGRGELPLEIFAAGRTSNAVLVNMGAW